MTKERVDIMGEAWEVDNGIMCVIQAEGEKRQILLVTPKGLYRKLYRHLSSALARKREAAA